MRSLENSKINTVKGTEWKTWQILSSLGEAFETSSDVSCSTISEKKKKLTKVKTTHTIKENENWTGEAAQWVKVLAPPTSVLVPWHKYVHTHTSTQ